MRNRTLALLASAGFIGSSAFAAAPDYSTLTAAVDFSTVATAILAMAALMIVPNVARWGARKVMSFIR